MRTTFIHTADWQLGKPFAGVEDVQKRALIQRARIDALDRIAAAAREHRADFIVVAGDLFDSPSATQATVSAACSAIGAMQIPVFAIPGNHDHGGPGSIWEQPFFLRERDQLAPNLSVLLAREPMETESAVLFPCPLLRRHEATDPTSWLRSIEGDLDRFANKPRLIVAHGSVQGFTSETDEEDVGGGAPNLIDLSRLPGQGFDFIALGDWHGMKQVTPIAWYAGTPELDRFPKGALNEPGHILVVTVERAESPEVTPLCTSGLGWHQLTFQFDDDAGLALLEQQLDGLIGGRAGEDLLYLTLHGSLGIEATTRLEQDLESWRARLLHLKLSNHTVVAPSGEEVESLTRRATDPLIAHVASRLVALSSGTGEDAVIARVALRELYATCSRR